MKRLIGNIATASKRAASWPALRPLAKHALAAGFLALGGTASVHGQILLSPGNYEVPSKPTFANRDEEFRALAAEVDALEQQLSLIRRIVNIVTPSTVHIEASKAAEAGPGFASSRVNEAGAGVIIKLGQRHFVMTNRHVVHPAPPSSIRIQLASGPVINPRQIWSDPSTDIAVLEVESPDLIAARIGNSEKIDIGDFVLAIGSPFGLSHSVTYGIISAKGRRNLELGNKEIEIQDFFQTDAAINPGNSGGPLLNLRGEVVGINTAIASNSGGNEGIGFSIPINMAITVAEQLVEQGKLQRAYLGVRLDSTFDASKAKQLSLSSARGALVKAVQPGSPAEAAGLQYGDVIVEFEGVAIESDVHLIRMAGLTPIGKSVDLIVIRSGKAYRMPVTLTAAPQ